MMARELWFKNKFKTAMMRYQLRAKVKVSKEKKKNYMSRFKIPLEMTMTPKKMKMTTNKKSPIFLQVSKLIPTKVINLISSLARMAEHPQNLNK